MLAIAALLVGRGYGWFWADPVMEKNRAWNEDAARLQLLKVFEALGPTDPLTVSGRRRLSSLLFS